MTIATMTRPEPAIARSSPAWQSDSIEMRAIPATVPLARARTRRLLREWGLRELADDAESVVAELIANAVGATRDAGLTAPVRLTLIAGLRTLLIAVWDATTDPPVPGEPGTAAESGRGLIIVEALAADWDWSAHYERGGKVVRALIRGTRHA